jgi:hypothetical protein
MSLLRVRTTTPLDTFKHIVEVKDMVFNFQLAQLQLANVQDIIHKARHESCRLTDQTESFFLLWTHVFIFQE